MQWPANPTRGACFPEGASPVMRKGGKPPATNVVLDRREHETPSVGKNQWLTRLRGTDPLLYLLCAHPTIHEGGFW